MASNLSTPKPSLASPIEKLNRARVNIDKLGEMVRMFLTEAPRPYAHRIDTHLTSHEELNVHYPNWPNPDGSPRIIKMGWDVTERFWVRIHINHPVPLLTFGVAVGEVVHNLRSALDNLIWELACLKQTTPPPPPPIPRGDDWRYVAFPICLDSTEWAHRITRRKLKLVDSKLHDLILREQPFFKRKNRLGQIIERRDPLRHPLARLEELWNRDKHRSITVVDSRIRFEKFGPPPADWAGPALEFTVLRRRKLGPFEDNEKLALVAVSSAEKVVHWLLEKYLENYIGLGYDIGFEKGFPGYGKTVSETLKLLHGRVTKIIAKFESEFR